MIADRYGWEVDEWREKFEDASRRLANREAEYEFHVSKLERTVAWLTVRLHEAETKLAQPEGSK